MYTTFTTFNDVIRDSGWFSRPFKEVTSYEFKTLENGNGCLLVNALGINKNDIEVIVEASDSPNKQVLKVSGKSELFDEKFQINLAFTIRPVNKIIQKLANGILYIELVWNKPVSPDIEYSWD